MKSGRRCIKLPTIKTIALVMTLGVLLMQLIGCNGTSSNLGGSSGSPSSVESEAKATAINAWSALLDTRQGTSKQFLNISITSCDPSRLGQELDNGHTVTMTWDAYALDGISQDRTKGEVQIKNLTCKVIPLSVSPADSANGITWHGTVTFAYIMRYRAVLLKANYYSSPPAEIQPLSDQQPFSPWQDAGAEGTYPPGLSILVIKQNGRWTAPVLGVIASTNYNTNYDQTNIIYPMLAPFLDDSSFNWGAEPYLVIQTAYNQPVTTPTTPITSNTPLLEHRLDVPFVSQWNVQNQNGGDNCGPASLTMVLHFYKKSVTFEQVVAKVRAQNTTGPTSFESSDSQELLQQNGLDLVRNDNGEIVNMGSFGDIKSQIDQNHPVIMAVNNSYGKEAGLYGDGSVSDMVQDHIVVVTGYRADESGVVQTIFINDPLAIIKSSTGKWVADGREGFGKDLALTYSQFEKAAVGYSRSQFGVGAAVTLVGGTLVACGGVGSTPSPEGTVRCYLNADESGDCSAMMKLYTDQSFVDEGININQAIDWCKEGLALVEYDRKFNLKIDVEDISNDKATVVATFYHTVMRKNSEKPDEWNDVWTFYLVKEDGKWLISWMTQIS